MHNINADLDRKRLTWRVSWHDKMIWWPRDREEIYELPVQSFLVAMWE